MVGIAVVGMACRYPDAASPRELWENILAGRRAFRRLPDERMRLADYWDPDPAAPDRFYARNAAVIEGYEFDRVGHRVAGSTFRSTDLTHWLALDVADRALADAGYPRGEGLPKETTGVVVGNTLAGEFTRANLMRLRWPYVKRVVGAALLDQGWRDDQLAGFLDRLEHVYKSPFPAIDEDTLAGGLANTIAGRICNHFDLNGGGYTVDGACSSSLLSVATACRALRDGEADVVIAGGVDLSIDPFEIIGFAKTGALARGEMRVYDKASSGFWPGEGCGMVVLMREDDAAAAGRPAHARIAGWGISSDGRGGITRPEVGGYRLALSRAYEMAGFGIDTVGLFEGHGTGTEVGDDTELTALSEARAEAVNGSGGPPAAIGSIKGMIGHTKAAAGVAGLIKAVLAVREQVLPPTAGCLDPHPLLTAESAPLRMLRKAEPWPDGGPVRAGVMSMGFGGINTHIVVEGMEEGTRRSASLPGPARELAASAQDAELLLVDGATPDELRDRLKQLADWAPRLSYAEIGDLAAALQRRLRDLPYRAAMVVSSPEDAERRLGEALDALDAGDDVPVTADGRLFVGRASGGCRIGYLFPGQGSGRGTGGGALRRRFAEVEDVYAGAALPASGDMAATAVAQPRIVTGTRAGLRALSLLGVRASVAVGHSLGEISALHWAGALDGETLLRAAVARGRIMTERSSSGTMAGIGAPAEAVEPLIGDLPVVVAGYNGPAQTVVAGEREAVEALTARARDAGLRTTALRVSHAFHSPLVAPAADEFGGWLDGEPFGPLARRVVSTVTGDVLGPRTDVPDLLRRQITAPVRFAQAVGLAAKEVDLFVEVGPGRVLSSLLPEVTDVPAVALDTDAESLRGLLRVAGAAYVSGAPVDHAALFRGRLTRPLEIGEEQAFFTSPCEKAPTVSFADVPFKDPAVDGRAEGGAAAEEEAADGVSGVELLRRLVAERAELPVEMVSDDSHLLDDMHLSSITVGQVMNQAARSLGVPVAQSPLNFATATIRELAETLEALAAGAPDGAPPAVVEGAEAWARPFAVDLDEVPLRAASEPGGEAGEWSLWADPGDVLAKPLRDALRSAGLGGGVLVCLPERCAEEHLALALEGAREALAGAPDGRFVLVQHGRGAAGLAKTLLQEAPKLRVTVVDVPASIEAVDWIVAEVAATGAFSEAHYDADGVRRVPTLRPLPVEKARTHTPLDANDVVLVTGGGKGITAECALSLAAETGARLALLGRSDPSADAELSANLRRMTIEGATARYFRADVTDAAQVEAAVAEITRTMGPVTAILHGAGRNEPRGLADLDAAAIRDAFAPKIDGLRNVLAATGRDRLRLLVTFGSIIGRAGLRGEAHYATANEWLADLTREFAAERPGCRAVCMEWSVWSGVGMGERLSVVESLAQEGITPITPDQGVEIMRRLVTDPDVPAVTVISGRTGGVDTVRRDAPPLPLLRFVDRPLVRYHGVELVAEVELNPGTDRYLADHRVDGDLLFPAVLGMEAMAQAAAAVTGRTGAPVIEQAEFPRPIVVPPDGSTTIRIAVVVTGTDTVRAVIRSSETGFAAEHFRAVLRVPAEGGARAEAVPDGPPYAAGDELPGVPLDPATDLYSGLLFQGDRFQRLRRYHRAAARWVEADVALQDTDWFAGYLPGDLVLGDPGMRDALMHGCQVCVPDATLLPIGIDRLHPAGPDLGGGTTPHAPRNPQEVASGTGELRFCATERYRDGDTYVYDIAVRTGSGEVVERWEGLRLRAVRKNERPGSWVAPLLGAYLERAVEDLAGARVAVAVEPVVDPDRTREHRARTALAAGRALGRSALITYRPDGRPGLRDGRTVTASHGAGVTLCAVGEGTLACDVEPVAGRAAGDWADLLGASAPLAALLTTAMGEDADAAGTRVWAALECLRKAGLPPDSPLSLLHARPGGWAVLASGGLSVCTLVTTLRDVPGPVVLAILTEGRS
ncbi:SDR family NAD(P)-dependent oxidoreductase [Actinomadura syzygii]|uniref:SDR family NAD(P)-dependent oxidoreductase n=1 Tax=Actinomadura syzygii TaxID=1427538 RepID=A0A5D0TXS5_9ACTN|nr:type I polyketide synthase [Actinomadura syzygii]TYC10240.1 SDR family NAD(P)-dependent oxidoreductase [Actinomadura syzygii]